MLSSMGYMKYGVVVLISAWMFFLGILVGRGTAPVSFDTKAFQEQLKIISEEYIAGKPVSIKPDLVFYEVLKKPSRSEVPGSDASGEILAREEDSAGQSKPTSAVAPNSIKQNLNDITSKSKTPNADSEAALTTQVPDGKVSASAPDLKKSAPVDSSGSRYTIQVASFKDLGDAQKVIDTLEAKGYPAYRSLGTVGEDIWFRVRVGSFVTMDEALVAKNKMESQGIKVLIIQKD